MTVDGKNAKPTIKNNFMEYSRFGLFTPELFCSTRRNTPIFGSGTNFIWPGATSNHSLSNGVEQSFLYQILSHNINHCQKTQHQTEIKEFLSGKAYPSSYFCAVNNLHLMVIFWHTHDQGRSWFWAWHPYWLRESAKNDIARCRQWIELFFFLWWHVFSNLE